MHKFGELLGMAFQIKDDLFDYSEQKIGKPTGIDIKEQKMTLPMIHALNVMDRSNKKWLINTVKNHNKDKKRVREAIQRIKEAGGLEFAEEKMEYFRVRAIEILKTFPKNTYRDSLELMVNYVIERSI
jgi:octaprenyl-diphosphate synthase